MGKIVLLGLLTSQTSQTSQTWTDDNNLPTAIGRRGGGGKQERGNSGGERGPGDQITVIYIEKPSSRQDPFGVGIRLDE